MSYGTALRAEIVRTLAFGAIGAGYVAITNGTDGPALLHRARQIVLQNFTDQTLMFSLDGVNDHIPLLSNGSFVSDIASNKITEDGMFVGKSTIFYVKQIGAGAATSGAVYLSVFFALGD
jgi:hypothetical protein